MVTFPEAMSGQYQMRLIRIRGRLAEERLRAGANLVLKAGSATNSFVATWKRSQIPKPFGAWNPAAFSMSQGSALYGPMSPIPGR